ncbi:translocation/assembly module TamB domain-containing protein [Melaminivora sp.]|uniref:translocation/assembly module TamB domain-containing protein n=1 Tax=Melaminivora sp. TaxID=1933032 RepID=UPI0028A71017|nr:translocation/assembly module TamB domain-containing protein [Melaminivora sp.]
MSSHQSPDPYAAAAAPPAAPPRKSRWRLLWRALALLGALLLALAMFGWWWAGSSTSLAAAVTRAAAWLPAGQQLETRDVSGSLRTGGRIGWLRWSSPTLAVEVEDAEIGWKLAPLLRRQVQLGEVHAARVTLRQQGEASDAPTQPLQELVLPVQVDVPFRIDHLVWAGRGEDARPLTIDDLAGRYRYDGTEHQVEVERVTLAQGQYALKATLGARAPMPLDATLDGTVRTPVPGSDQALTAQAHARVTGTLATEAARLDVVAQLREAATQAAEAGEPQDGPPAAAPARPAGHPAPGAPSGDAGGAAMRADVQARIAPWKPQPLIAADARLEALDLAALWPQAPATGLSGSVSAQPEGEDGWQIGADLANALPGPWDQGRLPVEALQAEAHYTEGTITVPQAQLRAGGGSVSLQGSYTPDTQALQGRAGIAGVNPARLHTRLAAAPLNGTASASGNAEESVRFEADLRAAAVRLPPARRGEPAPLLLQRLATQGRWQGQHIDIAQLLVAAQGARVQGQALRIDIAGPGASGRVQAELPGASARIDGQIAPNSGAGNLQLAVSDARRAQGWLAGLGIALAGWSLDGSASLDARWRGGWQSAQRQLQAAALLPTAGAAGASAPAPAGDFTLQARLQAPRLSLAHAPRPGSSDAPLALELAGTSASLDGSLRHLALALEGRLRQDKRQADVQLRAQAGSRGAGRWQGEVQGLQLRLDTGPQPGPWTVQLAEPLSFTLQQAPRLVLEASGASARVRGPAPGEALVRWQPLRYASTAQGGMELRSQGTLQGVPLAWANLLQTEGQGALERLGLSGDLMLGGSWDVDAGAGQPLRARVIVQRASGDLRIDTPEPTGGGSFTVVHSSGEGKGEGRPKAQTVTPAGTSAGLREAVVELTAEGQSVRARLSWDSERAGRIQAEGSTQLAQDAEGGWLWPDSAPLAASVRAEMPEVGVWSMLAPPGWRVHGTLSADARVSGTRAAPHWTGRLAADRFAIRSVLDGVDLQDGRLRATLEGQQLTITELHLKGGHGSRARIAGFSGNRTAAPADGGTLIGGGTLSWAGKAGDGAPAIRMDLNARAERLQVLVRADRQVSVSGTLRAQLHNGQLVLRGDLRTDRATIILPEAGAPTLGDDVVVRSAALDRVAAEKAGKSARAAQAEAQVQAQGSVQAARPPDIALSLDLGDDFALQGRGVTTRLTGRLQITSSGPAGGMPRVTGEVRTDQGRYRAWGQALDVESGLLRFNGPYDNPSLEVLALRPNIPVRAGVQVTGTAKAPRVRLYSEPELPDAEKLSWVVLGRSAAAGGAEAALLQQAALAFLAGEGKGSSGGIAQRLGFDEVGFKGPGQGEDANGAALTFGKRLSKDLYVTYEKSLSGTMGVLYIFYDLSRRLTLRGQTGTQSAVDLIYTVRWD